MKHLFRKIAKKFLSPRLYNDLAPYLFHLPKAVIASFVYGFPAGKTRIIGVAGTKGKSTTTYLISQLLESLGFETAVLSTTTIKIGKNEKLNNLKMTTSDAVFLQKFIKQAIESGCGFVILETSSHALKQFRTWGLSFELVVLTNMMPDHQEYHKSVEEYSLSHKKMIGPKTKTLVLNGDDPSLESFKKMDVKQTSFGLNSGVTLYAKDYEINQNGLNFKLVFSGKEEFFSAPLPGKFNLYNVLAALAAVHALGFEIAELKEAVLNLKPAPGRVEKVENLKEIEIIVDYAHSPDSFENLFSAVKPYLKKKLISVTGACGERDASKRPVMGKILAEYSDLVVITNGLEESGKFRLNKNYWKILDRKSAIKKSIELAKKGDTIVILGKGAEQWQMFKDSKIPWDDREIVKEALEE